MDRLGYRQCLDDALTLERAPQNIEGQSRLAYDECLLTEAGPSAQ